MAKKGKKNSLSLSRRGKEKLAHMRKSFNVAIMLYLAIVLVAVVLCAGKEYELGRANFHGFALWFLLLPAYIPLELWAMINWIFEWSIPDFSGYEPFVLGACDYILAIGVWGWMQVVESKRHTAEFFRVTVNFLNLINMWGLFQIFLVIALSAWNFSGMTSLHRHLNRPDKPDPVVIVDKK